MDMATTWQAAVLLGLITALALIINLPFGYLRGNTRKFSFKWFLYIHLPIPLIIVLRVLSGFGMRAIPIIAAGAIIGQLLGGRLYNLKVS
jgi:hypothetical protein